jgi:hypothetical protein
VAIGTISWQQALANPTGGFFSGRGAAVLGRTLVRERLPDEPSPFE